MNLRTTIGGKSIRLKLANASGNKPTVLDEVHVALSGNQVGEIQARSDHKVTFAGSSTVTIPPGVTLTSDPIDMAVQPLTSLSVSIYAQQETGLPTNHLVGSHTALIGKGNLTADARFSDPADKTFGYLWLAGVDVDAPAHSFAIVAFGDSITDGYGSTLDKDNIWPALFAKRLQTVSPNPSISVLNEGISGNQVLQDGAGVSALARFDRDVLGQSGVRWVILLEGINDINLHTRITPGIDISTNDLTTAKVIDGYKQLILRAHAHGIQVMGATLTPEEGISIASVRGEQLRNEINAWIRTNGNFDAVVDFDKAIRDEAQPKRVRQGLDSDHIHPNDAGYQVMADAVPAEPFLWTSQVAADERSSLSKGRTAGPMYPTDALVSPDVHPDRTVTFRFSAPEATAVSLVGEINQGKGPKSMSKDDKGLWTITVGPLPPEIWIYNFRIQGIDVVDPSNPSIKPVPPGQIANSFVEVPGDAPALYDSQPVPHGQVRMLMYESHAMGVTRWLWVYTPPGYDATTSKYPVLYLLHGNGEDQSGWVRNGRANIILDNLIAEHKVKPMIMVMPQGHALQGASVDPIVRLQGETSMFSPRFQTDLLGDVLPLVEKQFRTIPDADHRAIAGLSMGGAQSLSIGLTHLDLFHYVIGFSAAIGGQFLDMDRELHELYAKPGAANEQLRLLAFYCGRQDFVYAGNQSFAHALEQHKIKHTYTETEGAHVWSVWRNNLASTLPQLFKN